MWVTFMTNKVPYPCMIYWTLHGTSMGGYDNGITTCAMRYSYPARRRHVYLEVV
jgi:hypothetical protein